MRRIEQAKQGARVAYAVGASLVRKALEPSDPRPVPVVLRKLEHPPLNDLALRVVSWNVQRGYGWDKVRKTLERIKRAHDPHVIFLQEWPCYGKSPFWDTDVHAKQLFEGWSMVYAPVHKVRDRTPYYNFSHTGNLVALRVPFSQEAAWSLAHMRRTGLGEGHTIERGAIRVRVHYHSGTLGLYNFHLENCCAPKGREIQAASVARLAADDAMALAGGDANFFMGSLLEGGIGELEAAGFQNLFAGAEIRALPRLDYFFAKGCDAVGTQLRGQGSDHQPILAEVLLPMKE